MFQARHYQFIADVLKDSCANTSAAWEQIVNELAEKFQLDNPHFQQKRFKAACGKDMRPATEILDNVIKLHPASRIGGYGANW
jgi:hypothetical protein